MSESADTITLPIGIEKDGKRYRTVIIDEMTGLDEEILANPKHKASPGRAITNLLQRVIQEVPGLMDAKANPTKLAPKPMVINMYQADRDAILIGLRRLSFGDTITTQWKCSRCGEPNEEEVDFTELDTREWDEDEDCVLEFELPRGVVSPDGKRLKTGVLRFPTGADTERVSKMARQDPGGATSALLAALIKDIEGMPVDANVTKRMASRDRQYLGELFKSELPGVQLTVDLTCPDCGSFHPEHRVDLSGFFTPT